MSEEQDSHWEQIAGELHGELNSEEELQLHETLSNQIRLHEFEKAQKIHENLAKTAVISSDKKNQSWSKVEKEISTHHLRWIKVTLKYAAIIIFASLAGHFLNFSPQQDTKISYSEVRAPRGQMSKVTLPDGTEIWLNSGTTIRYPDRFVDGFRSVSMSGEAYFEVARMPKNPFTVKTSNLQVEVTGTSFNVSAYKDDPTTSVTLVEGKVELKDNNGKTIARLNPGQLAVKSKNNSNVNIKDVETSFYKAWIDGRIFFDDQPLDQIATKLERWFNVDIEFATERLKNYKFTGTILKNKPLDQIMQALELLAPIRFKHQVNATGKDKITIYKRT